MTQTAEIKEVKPFKFYSTPMESDEKPSLLNFMDEIDHTVKTPLRFAISHFEASEFLDDKGFYVESAEIVAVVLERLVEICDEMWRHR